ncbi:MAG: aldolase/citrate lyase family protein [Pseudomonadota bacterium]
MHQDLKELLRNNETILGTWSQIAAPELIDIMGLNGFRFTIIDCQHGPFGIETAENLARAADANNIGVALRVSQNDPVEIMKALDAGIRHVVIPNVETAQEAKAAVSATRFAPNGLRGACPCCRSGGHYIRNWESYVQKEEKRTGAIVLVETKQGHENIKEICAVPDLAGLMVGPFDLSVSMGFNGDWRQSDVLNAVEHMVGCGIDAGLDVIMPVFAPTPDECSELIKHWQEYGVRTFVIGSDKIILAEAFAGWAAVSSPK